MTNRNSNQLPDDEYTGESVSNTINSPHVRQNLKKWAYPLEPVEVASWKKWRRKKFFYGQYSGYLVMGTFFLEQLHFENLLKLTVYGCALIICKKNSVLGEWRQHLFFFYSLESEKSWQHPETNGDLPMTDVGKTAASACISHTTSIISSASNNPYNNLVVRSVVDR